MPNKDETDPISDDEWLYRRVHRDRFRNNRSPFVSPSAFEPRTKGDQPDIDGISLFRADCLDSATDVLALISDLEKRNANGIVKISVRDIRALGLTVVSTPSDQIAGHVSVPELCSASYLSESTRQKCKEWMHSLAVYASPDDRIVLRPES